MWRSCAAGIDGRRGRGRRSSVRVGIRTVTIATSVRIAIGIAIIAVVRIAVAVRIAIVSVAIGVRVVAIVRVLVSVLVSICRSLILVVAVLILGGRSLVAVLILVLLPVFGFALGRRLRNVLALLWGTAHINGDRLPDLDHFASMRQLVEHYIGLVMRRASRTLADVEPGIIEHALGRQKILADEIRDFDLRSPQREIDGAGQSEEESDGDGDDNPELAQRRERTLSNTHNQLFLFSAIGRGRRSRPQAIRQSDGAV